MDCRQIESLLTPYVDGEAGRAEVALVEAHLAQCASCTLAQRAQRVARDVVRAQAAGLRGTAPVMLHLRVAEALRGQSVSAVIADARAGVVTRGMTPRRPATFSRWLSRAAACAAAAVLLVAALIVFESLSPRSGVLFAAQLAIDHVRCFIVELGTLDAADSESLQQQYAREYGWTVQVPPSSPDHGITLIAARRCPMWLGRHAHLMYRTPSGNVSLFVDQDGTGEPAERHALGHVHRTWQRDGVSYSVIASAPSDAALEQVVSYLRTETEK